MWKEKNRIVDDGEEGSNNDNEDDNERGGSAQVAGNDFEDNTFPHFGLNRT
jgi:hypothetical protein